MALVASSATQNRLERFAAATEHSQSILEIETDEQWPGSQAHGSFLDPQPESQEQATPSTQISSFYRKVGLPPPITHS